MPRRKTKTPQRDSLPESAEGEVCPGIEEFEQLQQTAPGDAAPYSNMLVYQGLVKLSVYTLQTILIDPSVSPATKIKAITLVLTGNPGMLLRTLAEANLYNEQPVQRG